MQSLGIPNAVDPTSGSSAGRLAIRLVIYGLIAILILAALAYAAYLRFGPAPPTVTNISTVPARVDTILGVVNSTGQIAPWTQAKLSFRGAGQIASIPVKVGDSVKKGDTLASLATTDFQIQVDQAQAKLESAQARLDAIQAGPRQEDVRAAQAVRDAAQAKLDGMLAGGRPEDVKAAQAVLASAQSRLHELQQGALATDVAAAQTGIDQAQADLTKRQADLADLVRPPDPQAIKEAELSVAAAKASYWKSQTTRDGTCGGISASDPRCQAANAQVGIDETTLEQAQAKLQQLQEGPKPEDVNAAKAAIAGAGTQLASARAKLAQVQAGTLPDEIAQAQAAVNQAKETIALKQHPYADSDIAQQREVVAQADAVLALKKVPYTPSDLAGAKADLHAAQSALDLAKFNLATATIVAPFDGVVSDVTFNTGEFYNGLIASPVVSLVDPLNLRLDVSIDENDISHVQLGEDVNITFDALPGQAFGGKVVAIAPNAAVQSGVATYTASVSLQNANGVKPGMTGNATIIYARHDNVLIVPNRALRTEGANRVVSVLEGNKVTLHQVTTGVGDDKSTEITSGLRAGDQVVIPSTVSVAPQFNGGPTR